VVCIFFVVYAHASFDLRNGTEESTAYLFMKYTMFGLSDGLARISVPLLGLISGYLGFRQISLTEYQGLVCKKFNALILPMIAWSGITLLIFTLYGLATRDSTFLDTRLPHDTLAWVNAFLSITDSPFNPPLHFLREVFTCFLLFPFFYAVASHFPRFTAVLAIVVFLSNGQFFLFESNVLVIFNRPSVAGLFVLGMCLRKLNSDREINALLTKLSENIKQHLILIGIALVCAILLKMNKDWADAAAMATRILGAAFFWSLALNLRNNRYTSHLLIYEKYAFLTFCSHYPLTYAIGQIYGWAFNWNAPNAASYIMFLVSPAISYLAARAFFDLSRNIPGIWVLTGPRRA